MSKPSDGLEPSTPSLPCRFWGGKGVHARSSATPFLLLIRSFVVPRPCRETSRVSFLMCPFCVRGLLSSYKTHQQARGQREADGDADFIFEQATFGG
jgi:hypothetical protein